MFERILLAAFALLFAVAASAADGPDAAGTASVRVGGEVATALRLDAAALRKLPRKALEADEHGQRARFDGVPLADVLRAAGVPLGEKLRGGNLALYVRVGASDGYRTVYSLAELDPALHEDVVLLADRRDGRALDAKEGPFRLVAPGDRRPARWVRQVVAIDVLAAPSP
jgi:DMSO/TMAO reductase YedYZ molybdopterin-dependent catalytic subunit